MPHERISDDKLWKQYEQHLAVGMSVTAPSTQKRASRVKMRDITDEMERRGIGVQLRHENGGPNVIITRKAYEQDLGAGALEGWSVVKPVRVCPRVDCKLEHGVGNAEDKEMMHKLVEHEEARKAGNPSNAEAVLQGDWVGPTPDVFTTEAVSSPDAMAEQAVLPQEFRKGYSHGLRDVEPAQGAPVWNTESFRSGVHEGRSARVLLAETSTDDAGAGRSAGTQERLAAFRASRQRGSTRKKTGGAKRLPSGHRSRR